MRGTAVSFPPRVTLGFILLSFLLCATSQRLLPQATSEVEKNPEATSNPQSASSGDAHPQNEVVVDQPQPPRVPIHIVPYGAGKTAPKKRSSPAGALSNSGQVQYWGGPVISNVHVVEVLWGNFVDSASTNGLEQFYTDITQSPYFGLLGEYSTVGLNGLGTGTPGSNQVIGPGVFDSPRIVINPSTCPGGPSNPACSITDAQIQSEIAHQLAIHALPTPVQDNQGNFNTVYMIYFPPGVTISLGSHNSCSLGGFCAYHSNVRGSLQPQVPYGVLPDFSQGGCGPTAGGCGVNSAFQNLTMASSHELAEAVTDVDVGTATAFAPPLAWADQTTGEEIGDFCAGDAAQLTVNSNPYTVQTEWSNMQSGCVSAPAHFQVVAPANVIPGKPFNATVTAQSSIGNFQLFGYNDTVHVTSSDPAGVLPADYTFVPGTDQGMHTFSVTLNTLGNQTIAVNDTLVTAMVGTSSNVNVTHAPDLTVASTHSGNFKQSDIGDTYSLTVGNVGDKVTDGSLVTVTDTLPFGLSATATNGTGWICSVGGTPTCTRNDALNANASYPSITLTVNISNSAPSPAINTVQVSGGGEFNTANDTGTDPTIVVQMPDLSISKSHVGSFSQGQVGENYMLVVSNVGFAPTDGSLITVTDTIPTGMTATGMSGTGWACSITGTPTCTRSDVINGFMNSYPPITLTVNVGPSTPTPSVTNTATVSGGGEVNTANDTANDVTTITPPAADLIISSTHSGDFTQGQVGATYNLTVTNIGPAATVGVVTVADALPFGFTATAIGGPGWTCSTPAALNLNCTRSDPLPAAPGPNNSYPPITITLNVDIREGTPQTNSVGVSGGGELNTANDDALDITNVIQLPQLFISQSHGVLAQGLTGVIYTLNVSNFSQGSTVGTVTVSDTLPASLTATSMSGAGWNCTLSTASCTRSDTLGPSGVYHFINLIVSVASNAPSTVTNTATVSGGGEIVPPTVSTDMATVLPPISFSTITGTATVKAGNTASFLFIINSPLPGNVQFSCNGLPQGTTCTFNPNPLAGPADTALSLSVTTTASAASVPPLSWPGMAPLYAVLLPLAVAGMVAGWRKGSPRPLRLVLCMVSVAIVLFLAACGGGSSSSPPPTPTPTPPAATPPGTYNVTLVANNSNNNTQATTPITLIVQ